MSFFGLTFLGPPNPIEPFKVHGALEFHTIADQAYEEMFMKYAFAGSELADDLQMADGATCMMRCDLLGLLGELLGRETTVEEIKVFRTCFDTTSNSIITLKEYMDSVTVLKTQSESPGAACTYVSNSRYRSDRQRHRRKPLDPQQYFTTPVTTSQEIGWNSRIQSALGQHGKKFFPLQSTEITLNEGRSISEYYGDL